MEATMGTETMQSELVTFFRLLVDETRLKIIVILAQKTASVEQLAALLKLRPSLVSHHLDKLAEAELVSARLASGSTLYELRTDTLHAMARRWLAVKPLPGAAIELSGDAYERKVLADFIGHDGRLKDIPAQQKKRDVILRHILNEFQPGERYSEKQVNAIVKRFHDDTASIRRYLVDLNWLKRESGIYWRAE
jgi:DNA-binding transcriptional ArsR family regulator